MSTRQVFTTDVSVSLLCRFCMQIFEFEMERVQAKRSTKLRSPTGVTPASEKKKINKKASGKRNKDVSEENAPRATGEEQPNTFSSRDPSSSQFAS